MMISFLFENKIIKNGLFVIGFLFARPNEVYDFEIIDRDIPKK